MKPIYKPGLFSTPMVQSIDQDRKSQTRRIIDPQPEYFPTADLLQNHEENLRNYLNVGLKNGAVKAKYQVGDIIYVRETCRVGAWNDEDHKVAFDYKASPELMKTPWIEFNDIERFDQLHLKTIEELDKLGIQPHRFDEEQERVYYKWEPGQSPLRWKPSIFMPMEAARFFLEVTNVRAERLQDISEKDAIAEGIEPGELGYKSYNSKNIFEVHAIWSFQNLWNAINGSDSWASNPWVWVYEFKKIEKPNNWPI